MEIQKHMSLLLLVCVLCVLTSLKFGCGSTIGDHYNRSCIESDKQALLLLKNSLVDDWNSLSSWVGDDCCSWDGIDCNNITGQVTKLHLGFYGLTGSIPQSIGNLTSLTSLHLSDNKIGGLIPESIGALTSLTELDLSRNNFRGSIPQSIGNLTSLSFLDLSSNEFRGCLPESACQLSKLERLNVYDNQLSGSIPECIGELSNLYDLSLSFNSWEGFMSEHHFVNLTSLKYFFISSKSNLVLNVSSNWIPPFQLQTIYMDSLKVGPKFPTWMLTQRKVRWIAMTNMSLFDKFPNFLCNVTSSMYIYLSDNYFSGELPECLGNLTDLQAFAVMNNDLSGNIPISLGYLPLFYLNLHNNKFQGKLPLSFQNLSNIVGLDVGKNNLSGILPRWTRPLGTLKYLILRSNNFHGRIPTHLCQHPAIQVLNLARNQFTGNIPLCFANFTAMITTYNYSDIQYPYSSLNNNIIIDDAKGPELAYTSTLDFLFSIDLSNNNISGEIPEELMDLHGLTNLNLAGNHLFGRIPVMIGNLDKLESLDLSRNELYGPIPQSMACLNFLSRLNLSFNDLSGRIPTGNQLQTLNDPSIFIGNNQLCGGPILKPCSSDIDSHNFQYYNEDDSDDEHIWFYAGIGPGLLVGFLGFCASLHFIKSWRYSYFYYVEQVFEKIEVTIAFLLGKFGN